ncbi:hypothetical protein ORJ04_02125 [Rheinheimera baltica]|uniref:Biopterin-dependent aromatic amino acid hydroxylase family profile domain-containing protein n=1 Tax=Rheinheimera baltica TaxID=67576 RepID=A0ABT9HUE5_9GAMM|nr:hypothetical protein [Rheinheimera baltica]MDP5134743.1 hypothetical protein [Rheinheimera baltica]
MNNKDSHESEINLVWNLMFNRNIDSALKRGHKSFVKGIEKLGLSNSFFPSVDFLNKQLSSIGWCIHPCEVMTISPRDWFALLIQKRFPVTVKLRSLSELDYSVEPDCFHDYFGHLPFLYDENLECLLLLIARMYMSVPNKMSKDFINRLYFYVFEFGLTYVNDEIKVIGAGFMSSANETSRIYNDDIKLENFSLEKVSSEMIHPDGVVNKAYVALDYAQLFSEIESIWPRLRDECKPVATIAEILKELRK